MHDFTLRDTIKIYQLNNKRTTSNLKTTFIGVKRNCSFHYSNRQAASKLWIRENSVRTTLTSTGTKASFRCRHSAWGALLLGSNCEFDFVSAFTNTEICVSVNNYYLCSRCLRSAYCLFNKSCKKGTCQERLTYSRKQYIKNNHTSIFVAW